MSMRDEMRQQGYSKEDEYFFKKDKELLAKLRDAADTRKKELEDTHRDQSYWMVCPKCGGALTEESLQGIVKVDRCGGCKGVFFDDGELDLFVRASRQE